jgi:methylase of polypeptide subunit release factors
VPFCADWMGAGEKDIHLHSIHAYPAKFPAFIPRRILQYAIEQGVELRTVADIFCGSGTVAVEANRSDIPFWGCDINPVATLISRTKTARLDSTKLQAYASDILRAFPTESTATSLKAGALARLEYWYLPSRFEALARLRNSIEAVVAFDQPYRDAFLCAFSAILKPTSLWKTRSTKPAYDETKTPADVADAFRRQCDFMRTAWAERSESSWTNSAEVHTCDARMLDASTFQADLIITSPPYVVSYDYADLHQLSLLWLGFADDHRELRRESIGCEHLRADLLRAGQGLNDVGTQVVFSLFNHDPRLSRAVARYYLDMQKIAEQCRRLLRPRGLAAFVIGNTTYRGVRIDNASHLAEALLRAGFSRLVAVRRQLANKAHTPFRDPSGRLSRTPVIDHVYADEFVLVAYS